MCGHLLAQFFAWMLLVDLPGWVPTFPNGKISLDSSPAEVVEYFKTELTRGKISFVANFDGIGTVIRARDDKTSCLISVRESSAGGATVRRACAPLTEPQVAHAAPSPTPVVSTTGDKVVTRDPAPKGLKLVEYDVTGERVDNVNFIALVNITMLNDKGETQQLQTKIPFHVEFYAEPGFEVYFSAQKDSATYTDNSYVIPRVTDVRDNEIVVSIKAGKMLVSKASAKIPFGIATAKGRVP